MDRVIKAGTITKTKPVVGLRFLFPGAGEWELRALPSGVTAIEAQAADPETLYAKFRPGTALALPMQELLVFPLWLATVDRSLMEGLVSIQLEKRGLLARVREEAAFDFRILQQEADRTLVSVVVLRSDFSPELCTDRTEDYRLSTDFLKLPDDALVIWSELGRRVFAFLRSGELVYVQSLAGNAEAMLAGETCCAWLALQAEGVLTGLNGIVFFGEVRSGEVQSLAQVFGMTPQVLPAPEFARRENPRKLLPYRVRQQMKERESRQRLQRICTGLGLAYLVLLLVVLGHYGWIVWQGHSLEKELALHRAEVQAVRDAASRWEALEVALEPGNYPVEMLYRCSRHLPEEGVRLVTFDQSPGHILLTGEAKNAAVAFKFADDLKKDRELGDYTWIMPPPRVLPNDSSQFQIEGKSRYATNHTP